MTPLTIPSPPRSGIALGPFTLHFYALCIVAGIVAGIWLGRRRWLARGGSSESLEGVLVWAVIAGIVGARLYHVLTDYQLYFGPGRQWWRMFFVWEGGLGIWGAVALGAVAAWWQCHRRGLKFWALADALAPGVILAQGIGRLGNWFNQELFGRPLDAWWALSIDVAHRPAGYEQFATFHPAFLYELLWDVAVAVALCWLDRRFRLGHGKVFALYVALYTLGRLPIEHLKIDPVNHVGGFRLNEYVSLVVLLGAVAFFLWRSVKMPGREVDVEGSAARGAEVEAVPASETGAAKDSVLPAAAAAATADETLPAGDGEPDQSRSEVVAETPRSSAAGADEETRAPAESAAEPSGAAEGAVASAESQAAPDPGAPAATAQESGQPELTAEAEAGRSPEGDGAAVSGQEDATGSARLAGDVAVAAGDGVAHPEATVAEGSAAGEEQPVPATPPAARESAGDAEPVGDPEAPDDGSPESHPEVAEDASVDEGRDAHKGADAASPAGGPRS